MCLMSKEIRINVRTTEQIKNDLQITAELRGLSVSALVNSLVVRAIREEKDREPSAFRETKKQPESQTKDEIRQDNGFNVKNMSSKQPNKEDSESELNLIESYPEQGTEELPTRRKQRRQA